MKRDELIQWAEKKAKSLLATLQDLIESDEEGNPFIPWNQGEGHLAAALVEAYEAWMGRACKAVCVDCKAELPIKRHILDNDFAHLIHGCEYRGCHASAIRAAMEEGKP